MVGTTSPKLDNLSNLNFNSGKATGSLPQKKAPLASMVMYLSSIGGVVAELCSTDREGLPGCTVQSPEW